MKYVNEIVKEDISYLFPDGRYLTDEMLWVEYLKPKTNLERKMHPSFSLIPNLQLPDFEEKFRLDVLRIAKRTLFHKCTWSCKKYSHGRMSNCHFDFLRKLVEAPGKVYPELGIITLQQLNAYINNHNPYVTSSCRRNNDIKFIATTKLALVYIYYITYYITKSDSGTHSSFLICTITLNKFLMQPLDEVSEKFIERSRRLVMLCLNKIAGRTELTGPQVAAYLLGLDDHYTPNKFISIYLNTFELYLTEQTCIKENLSGLETSSNFDDDFETNNDESEQESDNYYDIGDEAFKIVNSDEKITAINLRIDYMWG